MINWFFGKQSGLPEPTALQLQKNSQIEQLREYNLSVTEVLRDVEYRVICNIGGQNLFLDISLPPQFPCDKPSVKVSPPVKHPWVNEQSIVIGSAGLNNFAVHSSLGKEIKVVIEEFKRNPPTIMQHSPYSGLAYPANPVAPTLPPRYPSYSQNSYQPPAVAMPTLPASVPMNSHSYPYPGVAQIAQNQTLYQAPEVPTTFSQLKDLSIAELQAMADDEDKLVTILLQCPELQKIARDRKELSAANEQQAKENLAYKPILEDKKRILLEKYDHLNDLRQAFEDLFARQNELRQEFDPSHLRQNLKHAAQEVDDKAEEIAEDFLQGKIKIDEFKKTYMEQKKLAYLRKAKEEKLSQMYGGKI